MARVSGAYTAFSVQALLASLGEPLTSCERSVHACDVQRGKRYDVPIVGIADARDDAAPGDFKDSCIDLGSAVLRGTEHHCRAAALQTSPCKLLDTCGTAASGQ